MARGIPVRLFLVVAPVEAAAQSVVTQPVRHLVLHFHIVTLNVVKLTAVIPHVEKVVLHSVIVISTAEKLLDVMKPVRLTGHHSATAKIVVDSKNRDITLIKMTPIQIKRLTEKNFSDFETLTACECLGHGILLFLKLSWNFEDYETHGNGRRRVEFYESNAGPQMVEIESCQERDTRYSDTFRARQIH